MLIWGPYREEQIKNFLPHRDPFLFVDCIDEIKLKESLTSEEKEQQNFKKLIGASISGRYRTKKEHPIFAGHFPSNPILPGVIQIEIMAQVSCFSLIPYVVSENNSNNRDLSSVPSFSVALAGTEFSKFRRPIGPEMSLYIQSECLRARGNMLVFQSSLYILENILEMNNKILASESVVFANIKIN